jgi:hypothetical protein
MDAAFACTKCGVANPRYRFWCRSCGADLSCSSESAIFAFEKELVASSELYDRVLADLTNLYRRGESTEAIYQTIFGFYFERRQAATALRGSIVRIRQLGRLDSAPANELDVASRDLQTTLGRYPRVELLGCLAQEVSDEISRRKAELAKKTTVSELIAAFRSCSDPAERENYLKRAAAIAPNDANLAAALEELRASQAQALAGAQRPAKIAAASAEFEAAAGTATPSAAIAEPEPITATVVESRMTPPCGPPTTSFAEAEEETPSPTHRFVEAASEWSAVFKPFLLDNVGWFVGAFLIVAGFLVLIAAFWRNIGANPILMRSLVFWSLAVTTGIFFSLAYFMRRKYPQLETSSNVLLIIVALLIPLIFAAAAVTTLAPSASAKLASPNTTDIRSQL